MGWSLDYLGPKEPELIEEFLLAVGKAVYLATAFESKCRYILRLERIMQHIDDTGEGLSAALDLVRAMGDKLLHGTIRSWDRTPKGSRLRTSLCSTGRGRRATSSSTRSRTSDACRASPRRR